MSIADKITSIETHITNAYDKLNNLPVDLTNVDKNINNISACLNTIYDNLPKATGESTEVSLNTVKGRMEITKKGNTIQDGTPSPDNEVPIKVVTGENMVTRSGKNLFDKNIQPAILGNHTIEVLSTGIRVKYTGASTITSTSFVTFTIMDLSDYVGKTIRLKTKWSPSANNKGRIVIGLCNSDGSNRSGKNTQNLSEATASFEVPELTGNQKYLFLNLYVNTEQGTLNQNDYVDFENIILTIDNADMTYEPYITPITKPLNLLKTNLFDMVLEPGSLTNGINANVDKRIRGKNYIPVQENTTYTLRVIGNQTGKVIRVHTSFYTVNDYTTQSFDKINYVNLQDQTTFTTPAGTNYIRFIFSYNPATAINVDDNFGQFVLAEGDSVYHELCKIGDTEDVLFKAVEGDRYYDSLSAADKALLDVGDWYKHEKINEYMFTGNENFSSHAYGTNSWSLGGFSIDYDTSQICVKSNILRGVSNNDRGTGNNIIYATSSSQFIIRNTSFITLTEIQNATKDNYIYYVCNPSFKKITNETTISQLEDIDNLMSNNGTTIISSSAESGNANLILDVSALKG